MKKLLILALASSTLFGNGAFAAQLQKTNTVEPTRFKTTLAKSVTATKYDAFMKAGYTAYNKKDYQTALTNFKSALVLRPKNVYAIKAIQNTEKRLAGK